MRLRRVRLGRVRLGRALAGNIRRPGCGVIDQAREHGEPADAVRQNVVQHHDDGALAPGKPGHHGRRPQRPVPGQAAGDGIHGRGEQGLLVTGRRARNGADVLRDVELRVVGPVRPIASEGGPYQALSQPGNRRDASGQRPPYLGRFNLRVEHQHRADLHRRTAGVRRQFHEIGRARALDHRCVAAGACPPGRHRRRSGAACR